MTIRPVDMPALRASLIEHYNKPTVVNWWKSRPSFPAMELFSDDEAARKIFSLNPSGAERRASEAEALAEAELFFVAAPMAELASEAAKSLPSFKVDEFDLPSPTGFLIFEKPIAKDTNYTGEDVYISGASWRTIDLGVDGPLLWFSFYVDFYRVWDDAVSAGKETPEQAAFQKANSPRFTYTTDGATLLRGPQDKRPNGVLNLWGKTIASTWLLMKQTLAEISQPTYTRADRRRLARRGAALDAVRVIELRRPRHSGPSGESDREYHHQWIVRGHWRQQWFPKREVHRPVWIAPHIKGPEGAPMLGGEKVHTWKR